MLGWKWGYLARHIPNMHAHGSSASPMGLNVKLGLSLLLMQQYPKSIKSVIFFFNQYPSFTFFRFIFIFLFAGLLHTWTPYRAQVQLLVRSHLKRASFTPGYPHLTPPPPPPPAEAPPTGRMTTKMPSALQCMVWEYNNNNKNWFLYRVAQKKWNVILPTICGCNNWYQ